MDPTSDLIIDSLKEEPIGETYHFIWFITDIGIVALFKRKQNYKSELIKFIKCCKYAKSIGLEVHAGHGLEYKTARILSRVKEITEFNIGHFIIGESIFFGLKKIIRNFKKI